MIDLYLSFQDEATAKAVLFTEVPTEFDTEGSVTATEPRANFANIDTIGVIYKRTGGTDEEPVMAPIPGWHVNVRVVDGEDAAMLSKYAVTPATPVRVWG